MLAAIAHVNWKRIAFWAFLWWFVYTAPTEGWLPELLNASSASSQTDTF